MPGSSAAERLTSVPIASSVGLQDRLAPPGAGMPLIRYNLPVYPG